MSTPPRVSADRPGFAASRRPHARVLALALLTTLLACSPVEPTGRVTVAGPSMALAGTTVRLVATVHGGVADPRVTWSVTGGGSFSDATSNPVDFTVPDVDADTVVVVRATSVADPSRSGVASITVRPSDEFVFEVDSTFAAARPTIPDGAGTVAVAASRDRNGVQSDFVVGQVLLRPASPADLSAFLVRFDGTVVRDDRVPDPPARLGIVLTPAQQAARTFVVRVNLDRVDLADLPGHAAAAGFSGLMSASSSDGLLTLAAAIEARATGFAATPNYLAYPTQTFPSPLFATRERVVGGVPENAFADPRFATGTGSASNVTLAWQFLMAHGIQRRSTVAIIDEGFWLDDDGLPRGADSDLPADPVQFDFRDDDDIAAGPAVIGCGMNNPCYWHGTGAAGAATGRADNLLGAAGTGGLVADPFLFKRGATLDLDNRAVRTAVAWGADVVNMSFGGDCDEACLEFRDEFNPFRDAIEEGSRTVFVAAAGNGRGTPAAGYDVGAPNSVRPCTDPNVICVGALANGATTRIGFSNFGAEVDVFAPTNLRVMSYPPSRDAAGNVLDDAFTAEVAQTFGGTSASAPFVAGVIAMMKAIDPALDHAQVRDLLRSTAHAGVAPVDRHIDAFAAVRAAAAGASAVLDRFEVGTGGDNIGSPTVLPGSGPWIAENLNLHDEHDRDYFRFDLLGPFGLTVEVAYPLGLGAIPMLGLDPLGSCGVPRLVGDEPLVDGAVRGRRWTFDAASGPYRFGLGGSPIQAYSLTILPTVGAAALPDAYEPNNTPDRARPLFSYVFGPGEVDRIVRDARADVAASLHTSGDVDYYVVTGKHASIAERVFLTGRSSVRVYDNDASITMRVFELAYDGQGRTAEGPEVFGSPVSGFCQATDLEVLLEPGREYLVRVSGAQGRYRLHNGISAEARHLPVLMRDRVHEVLNPLEPIERLIPSQPAWYVFLGDPAFDALETRGDVLLRVYDAAGDPFDESVDVGGGLRRLSLAGLARHDVYLLEVVPTTLPLADATFALAWASRAPARSTGNLLVNAGAEAGAPNPVGHADIPGWYGYEEVQQPTVLAYGTPGGFPTSLDPGPVDRGAQFFAGRPGVAFTGIRQDVTIPPSWYAAVDAGQVKYRIDAYLGGREAERDAARVTVSFVAPASGNAVDAVLGPVSPIEREQVTGLFPRGQSSYVPPSTRVIHVTIDFIRADGSWNDGYADELYLELLDYP